jgi:hypothetical protein
MQTVVIVPISMESVQGWNKRAFGSYLQTAGELHQVGAQTEACTLAGG